LTDNQYGKITPEALARLRARIGRVFPIDEPYVKFVNPDSIRHAAHAIGDDNPLYNSPQYAAASRFGNPVAPPALLYAVAWGSWDMRRGEGLPGVHGLHAGDRWFYYRPLLAGDEVTATKVLLEVEPMEGRWAGESYMQVREFRFHNQREELVARCLMSAIRGEREESRTRAKHADIEKAKYTPEEISAVEGEIAEQNPRGSQPRYWEDIQVGEPVQQLTKGPLTVAEMISWIRGIGSPHVRSGRHWVSYLRQSPRVAVRDPVTGIPEPVERVHWDSYMAAEVGMPAPYDYGSQRGAWATQFVTNWIGDDAWPVELAVQYRGINFLGDVVRLDGSVTRKWRAPGTSNAYVEFSIRGVNQRGHLVMPGSAVAALPSRTTGTPGLPILEEDFATIGTR